MEVNEKYLTKAKMRLTVAKQLISMGYWCVAVSVCYYSMFNLMQALVGNPPGKKWKHKGIVSKFCRMIREEKLTLPLSPKEISRRVYELYELRRISDYSEELLTERKEEVNFFVEWVENIIKEVENEFRLLKK